METESGPVLDFMRSVGSLVAEHPRLARVLEGHGIDYCCGGARSLAEACAESKVDRREVLGALAAAATSREVVLEPVGGDHTIAGLVAHIQGVHHAYLRRELPRLIQLATRTASAHGARDSRWVELRREIAGLAQDLEQHMLKEEMILFPAALAIERGEGGAAMHCGGIENPLRAMEAEHEEVAAGLGRLRALTDHDRLLATGCATSRELAQALAAFERDLRHHVHEENNLLHSKIRAAVKG